MNRSINAAVTKEIRPGWHFTLPSSSGHPIRPTMRERGMGAGPGNKATQGG